MNRVATVVLCMCLSLAPFSAYSQPGDTLQLTLPEVVAMARENSISSMAADNQLATAYWQYRLFQSNYRPTLRLNSTLPNLDRTIRSITLPDGSDAFVPRSLASSSIGLNLQQRIKWTGGQVFVGSDVERIDIFSDPSSTSYLASPVTVGFVQPLFQHNPYRWEHEIAPLQYEEAKKTYLERLEQVSIDAVQQFFDLYLAQINVQIAQQNVANNDTLLKISRGRYNLGKIGENDLLQMELQLNNAQSALAKAKLDVRITSFRLKRFLRLEENVILKIIPPSQVPEMEVDLQKALEQARDNRSQQIAFERQLLESERAVDRAKKETDFDANIQASFGINSTAPVIGEIYNDPRDYQQFSLNLNMPIVDWGKGKAEVAIAQSQNELVVNQIEQQSNNFDQEVMLEVSQFDLQRDNLKIAAKSDTIANKRYRVAKNRFIAGKVSITDLNVANTERDVARRDYISSLRNFWVNYYNIRKITLYDFEANRELELPEMNY